MQLAVMVTHVFPSDNKHKKKKKKTRATTKSDKSRSKEVNVCGNLSVVKELDYSYCRRKTFYHGQGRTCWKETGY